MSRFPKLTETFVLFEIVAVERAGVDVLLYPLQRERTTTMHPEARALLPRVRGKHFFDRAIAAATLRALWRRPRKTLAAFGELLRGTWGSARYFGGVLAFFPKALWFAEQMRRDGIEHIHAHFAHHPAAIALAIHRLTGIPFSFTAHGSDLHRDKRMLGQKVAASAFALTVSDFNLEVMRAACGEALADRMAVLRCGADTAYFRPAAPVARDRGALRLVCVGTLHEVKGQIHLIEACALLRERGIDFVCELVGDGPDRSALERRCAELGLAERVRFLGPRLRGEVAELLRRADVAVAPSVPSRDGRREGLPVALMEAAASGLPLVASRLSGIPELVEDGVTGLLVPPGDAAAIAFAIERLAKDAETRQRLGLAARERVLRDFDQDRNARAIAARFAAAIAR
jgi:glycosyltransferase involved in cell wall biosynthesis